jgi:hypothetical protein
MKETRKSTKTVGLLELTHAAEKIDLQKISSEVLRDMVGFVQCKNKDLNLAFQNWTDTNWAQWRDHSDASPW